MSVMVDLGPRQSIQKGHSTTTLLSLFPLFLAVSRERQMKAFYVAVDEVVGNLTIVRRVGRQAGMVISDRAGRRREDIHREGVRQNHQLEVCQVAIRAATTNRPSQIHNEGVFSLLCM